MSVNEPGGRLQRYQQEKTNKQLKSHQVKVVNFYPHPLSDDMKIYDSVYKYLNCIDIVSFVDHPYLSLLSKQDRHLGIPTHIFLPNLSDYFIGVFLAKVSAIGLGVNIWNMWHNSNNSTATTFLYTKTVINSMLLGMGIYGLKRIVHYNKTHSLLPPELVIKKAFYHLKANYITASDTPLNELGKFSLFKL